MALQPDPRIVRLAELDIDPARIDPYLVLLREEIEAAVRLEPGVLALYAMTIKGNPAAVRLTEVYADQQAYEAHLQTRHFLKYKAGSAGMVLSLRLIEAEPVLLAGKIAG